MRHQRGRLSRDRRERFQVLVNGSRQLAFGFLGFAGLLVLAGFAALRGLMGIGLCATTGVTAGSLSLKKARQPGLS